MKSLQVKDIIKLHSKMAAVSGGASSIRDIGSVERALNRCHSSFDGQDLYAETIQKI